MYLGYHAVLLLTSWYILHHINSIISLIAYRELSVEFRIAAIHDVHLRQKEHGVVL